MKTEYRFGLKIRDVRIDHGWTQEQLAENADLSTRTVQRAEKDKTQDPETLAAIAAAFNVTVADLRRKYWVTESKLPKARLIESAEGFRAVIQRGYHYYSQQSLVMPTPEAEAPVKELREEIFADFWAIDDDEPGLLSSYIESISKPVQDLRNMGMAFFCIQECRDVIIKGQALGERIPMEDITLVRFLLVPVHGCFQLSHHGKLQNLHRFWPGCAESVQSLLQMIKQELDLSVASNVIYAMAAEGDPDSILWCDVCFPLLEDESRISLEYLHEITSLSVEQMVELDAEVRAAVANGAIQLEETMKIFWEKANSRVKTSGT